MLLRELFYNRFVQITLERKPHARTKISSIAKLLVAIEPTSVNECADMVGEAVFKTGSDISVTPDITIPRGATAHQYIGSKIEGADWIAEKEIAADGQMKCDSVAIKPLCLISDTKVASEEEVHTKAATRPGFEYASIVAKDLAVKPVDLPFHITESAGFGSDHRLNFLEGFCLDAATCEGVQKRQCND